MHTTKKQPNCVSLVGPAVMAGFTLVELLVVIGIIAVLIGILIPALSRAREKSRQTACLSNLHQIGLSIKMYSNDFHDHYPDARGIGWWWYRRQPGLRDPADPSSRPEWLGLAAMLQGINPGDFTTSMTIPAIQNALSGVIGGRHGYMAANSRAWICPSAPDKFADFGNTYVYTISQPPAPPFGITSVGDYTSGSRGNPQLSKMYIVYDNVSYLPYVCGQSASINDKLPSQPSYTLKTIYYHRATNGLMQGQSVLFLDGSAKAMSPLDQGG